MNKSSHQSFRMSTLSKSIAIAVSMWGPSNLLAQEQGAEEQAITILEEIVVTARSREESLQDVPLAITAFDASSLKKKSISELEDVARFTPGFSFEDFSGGLGAPVVRGQAQVSITALEQNVSAFFDGLYIPRAWAIDVGTSNISRIEVVKGPQSARYGRNAFSGAINYIPNKAIAGIEEFAGDVSVTLGSDEREDVGASIQLPLSDKFTIAASYNTSEFDGSWGNNHPFADLNVGTKGTQGNVGGWDKTASSISLAAALTDDLSFDLAFYNYETENEARAGRTFEQFATPEVFNCGGQVFGSSLLICGELPAALERTTVDPRTFGVHSDTDIVRFSTSYNISDAWSVSYLYGNIDGGVDIGTSTEPDPINCGSLLGPPVFAVLCNFQATPIGGIDYDSHEIRFNYEGDSIRYAFGGFSSEGEDDFNFFSYNIAPVTSATNFVPLAGQANNVANSNFNPGPFITQLRDQVTTTDVTSIFGEIHWTSSDGRTRAGVEVRYSDTEIDLVNIARGTTTTFNDDYSFITPRLTFERDLNDNRLLFASLSRGAKTGGFNGGAIAAENQTFDEEFNTTLELGMKNSLLDGRMTLNASLYYTDWQDIQVNSSDPDAADVNSTSIILNRGNADVYGAELDMVFLATQNITFDATFSHADATYKSGTVDQRFVRPFLPFLPFPTDSACDDVVCNSNGDVSGNEVERAPQTQVSFGAEYAGEMANASFFVRSDVSWQSSFYASPVNVAELPSRTLVNLSAGIDWENGFGINAWVRNLADEEYVSNSFVVITPFNNLYNEFYGERRTIGITASYKF